ncbi:VapE domain-containing protein [Bosea sp. ANAM02]|uniref:VapE domain-containing protein n=1 Tax=Bosea sp. ANAM02 TaxID=2020412 RepID=UPI00140EA4B5|nr:VapE domain-containing protein [Bosea sp. ANAM02]BCB20278.1 hypothetical protein OCUBac02_31720 [Bosea sp. ANAM02]
MTIPSFDPSLFRFDGQPSRAAADQLAANGYQPIPITAPDGPKSYVNAEGREVPLSPGKRPELTNWQVCNTAHALAHFTDGCNLGLRMGGVSFDPAGLCSWVAFDVDFGAGFEAEGNAVRDLLRINGQDVLIRVGRPPKFLALRRLPVADATSRDFKWERGADVLTMQLLADGTKAGPKQFVAYGLHPDRLHETPQGRYEWHGGDPLSVPADAVPVVDLWAGLAAIDQALAPLGWKRLDAKREISELPPYAGPITDKMIEAAQRAAEETTAEIAGMAEGTGRGGVAFDFGLRFGIVARSRLDLLDDWLAELPGEVHRDLARGCTASLGHGQEMRAAIVQSELSAAVAAHGGAAGVSSNATALTKAEEVDGSKFAPAPATQEAPVTTPAATKTITPMTDPDTGLITTKEGDPLTDITENVLLMARYLGAEFRHNEWERKDQVRMPGRQGWEKVEDRHKNRLFMKARGVGLNYPVGKEFFYDGLKYAAGDNVVDPMRDYLGNLHQMFPAAVRGHDSGLTLENWLPAIVGVEDTPYHRAVGRYLVGSMIRRILLPGCKSDEMVVLISKDQGKGKSTFCKELSPDLPGMEPGAAFCESLPLGADDKKVLEETGGKAVVEFAEMATVRGKEVEHVKSMLSKTHDSSRLAYGSETTERGRRFIFIGTTNDETPLRDQSGDRRFLPVKMPEGAEIDLARFREAKEWLLRLAVQELVASNWTETFRLPRELWGVAAEVQAASRGRSNCEELLIEMLGDATHGEERIAGADVELFRSTHRGSKPALGRMMKDLGFEREQGANKGNGAPRPRHWVRITEGLTGSVQFVLSTDRKELRRPHATTPEAGTGAGVAAGAFQPGPAP